MYFASLVVDILGRDLLSITQQWMQTTREGSPLTTVTVFSFSLSKPSLHHQSDQCIFPVVFSWLYSVSSKVCRIGTLKFRDKNYIWKSRRKGLLWLYLLVNQIITFWSLRVTIRYSASAAAIVVMRPSNASVDKGIPSIMQHGFSWKSGLFIVLATRFMGFSSYVWFLLVLAIMREILEDVSVALRTLGLYLWLYLIFTINNKILLPPSP